MVVHKLWLSLAEFELSRCIGHGGMGEVWAGRHRLNRAPVAVKLLNQRRLGDHRYLALFRNEVRLAASLEHPSIITVFDHGVVPEAAAAAARGALQSGTPYLVMERVSGGTLAKLCGKLGWADLKRILLRILDALAHAHARGVMHRDLKPSNVLFTQQRQLKLSDFGLAYGYFSESENQSLPEKQRAGTPAYMAPEQFEGRVTDYGPATDLYALGCLTYELCTGSPPFALQRSPAELRVAHLYQAAPPLPLDIGPMPDLFRRWLQRLLAKDPRQRFQRAADAAWQLEAMLGAARHTPKPQPITPLPVAQSSSTILSWVVDAGTPAVAPPTAGNLAQHPTTTATPAPPSTIRPTFPATWRSHPTNPQNLAKRARGLSNSYAPSLAVYGLRPFALIARDQECDRLWNALRRSAQANTPYLALVRGPAGIGKSRLAQWLCERAHELGVATYLKAVHSPTPTPNSGLLPMLRRFLRLGECSKTEVLLRLEASLAGQPLPATELRNLAELLASNETELRSRITFAEQSLLVRQFLVAYSKQRPLIVWLDDAQWAVPSLEFAHLLCDQAAPPNCRILLLLTVQDDALLENPIAQRLLEHLLACAQHELISLGPLSAQYWPTLVQERLGLTGELAVRVEERTAGNPLFAIQLVGDWMQRGLLEATPAGFKLKPGASADIPDELHQMWLQRVERFLAQRPVQDVGALEIAATLGQHVDAREWHEACASADLEASDVLRDALIAERLAEPSDRGESWTFVHGMLQECLERRAKEAGRAANWHRACANSAALRSGVRGAERQGRHLLAARIFDAAITPLIWGAHERLELGDLRGAEAILGDLDNALAALQLAPDHLAHCESTLARAFLARSRSQFAEAQLLAERALAAAQHAGFAEIRVRALWEVGLTYSLRGLWEQGDPLLHAAVEQSRQLQNPNLYVRCIHAVADALLLRGDPSASGWYSAVISAAQAAGETRRAASATILRMWLELRSGERASAIRRLELLAGLALAPADPADARTEGAVRLLNAAGLVGRAFVNTFLAIVYLEHGRFAEAHGLFLSALETFELHGRLGEAVVVLLGMACCSGGLGRWDEFDTYLSQSRRVLEQTGRVIRDLVTLAEAAAAVADRAGEALRARMARELAASQRQKLTQTDIAVELQAQLAASLPPQSMPIQGCSWQ